MTTYTFDFQKIADNLTIEVRIRPAHRQQVYQQMVQRFEQTGGKAGMGMPMRIAAMVLISVGLVGTVVVIQGLRTQDSGFRSATKQRVQRCIDSRDIPGLIGFAHHDQPDVQIAAITALGQIGDVTALAALTALLETPITEAVRTATLAAIDQLRQRLHGALPESEPNVSAIEPVEGRTQDSNTVEVSAAIDTESPCLTLTVLDANESPIADAEVEIRYHDHRWTEAVSDQGLCSIALPREPFVWMMVTVLKRGYVGKTLYWNPSLYGIVVPQAYTVHLSPGVTWGGQVVDQEGKPIKDVEVMISLGGREATENETLFNEQVVSDANGHWQIDDIPERVSETSIKLKHPNYSPSDYYDASDRLDALLAQNCVLTMIPALTLGGQVIDEQEHPIAGAEVRRLADLSDRAIYTNDQGIFAFTQCTPEEVPLSILAPGYAPYLRHVDINDQCVDLSYVLTPGQSLQFKVTDANGRPMVGAQVKAERWREARTLGRTNCIKSLGLTNDQGLALLNDLPSDEVLYSISKDGYATWDNWEASVDDGLQEVTLSLAGKLVGRVFNAVTGEPMEGFSLIKAPHWPGREGPVFQSHMPKLMQGSRFELPLAQQSTGMAVRITAPGFANFDSETFYNDGTEQELEVHLSPAESIQGTILDVNGMPVEKAMVVVSREMRLARLRQGNAVVSSGDVWTETDAEGSFTLSVKSDYTGVMVVAETGVVGTPQEQLEQGQDFTLQPWASLTGTMTINGAPAPKRTVSLSMPDPICGRFPYHYRTQTDDQGFFSFSRVIPGRSTFYRKPGEPGQTLTLEPGETRHLDVTIEGVEVTAQLEMPDGLGFGHCQFEIKGRPNPEALGAADLDLVLPDKLSSDWYNQWISTEDGRAYREIVKQVDKIERYHCPAPVYATGLLHLETIPPGDYWLTGTFRDPELADTPNYYRVELGRVRCALTVPEGGDSANLGTLTLESIPAIEVGGPAPELTLFGLDAGPITLDQFRGRYLVLDLGFHSYRGDAYAQDYVPVLQRAAAMEDVEILSVDISGGFPVIALTSYMQQKIDELGVTWPLAVPDSVYGVRDIQLDDYRDSDHFPSLMLLDPEGHILGTEIPVEQLEDTITQHLSR